MREVVDQILDQHAAVAARADFLAVMGRSAFDDEVRRRLLTAVFPRAYARPWDADEPTVRLRAALASVGGEVALSHTTALGLRGLPVPPDEPIHVTAYNPRHPRGVAGELIVHRTLLPLRAQEVEGLAVVPTEVALATSWPLLPVPERRAPVIEASRRGLVHPGRLADVAEKFWWVRGIRAFGELVGQLLAGCESELELWGYTDVFAVPGLDDATRQLRLRIAGRLVRLDMAYEAEKLAVELDGSKYHSGREQRERDIRRDLLLATAGWLTIRLSHDQLRYDVEGCRRDVLAVRAARRERLA